jgi:hypothetical protein
VREVLMYTKIEMGEAIRGLNLVKSQVAIIVTEEVNEFSNGTAINL